MRTAIFALIAALACPSGVTRAADSTEGWEFVGVTRAWATAVVQSRVTGYVTQVAIQDGAAVQKGDLLIEIDPRPYQLAREAAQAQMQAAEAKLKMANIERASAEKMLDKNVISMEELALRVAAEEAALRLSKVEVERAELTRGDMCHPYSGQVMSSGRSVRQS